MAHYDRYRFSNEDWHGQGDLRRALCEMEIRYRCGQELFNAILNLNTVEFTADLEDQVVMVIGNHGIHNYHRGSVAPPYMLADWLKEVLQNELIKAVAMRNPLYIDEDGIIRPTCEKIDGVLDYGQTVVVDDDHRVIFVLEAGYQYIRLVTVFPMGYGVFHTRKSTKVIRLRKGVTTMKMEYIPEVDFQDRLPDYNVRDRRKKRGAAH